MAMKGIHRNTWLTIPALVLPITLILILPLWNWPTLPGEGLNITLNLLIWTGCALWGLSLVPIILRTRAQVSRAGVPLAIGTTLMCLPWLWTPEAFHIAAAPRLVGLGSLALLLVLLLQLPLRGGDRRRLYAVICIAGLIQGAIALWQLLGPDTAAAWTGYNISRWGGRPTALLLQVNILGSFLASALGCSLWLALSSHSVNGRRLAYLCVFLLTAITFATGSRTAQLATIPLVIGLVSLTSAPRAVRLIVCTLFITGMLASWGILALRPATLPAVQGDTRPVNITERRQYEEKHSDSERITLIWGSQRLIHQHPFTGTGLATFERELPEALYTEGMDNPIPLTVSHPHNELLYVWSEGGVVAFIGLLLWMAVWSLPFLRRRRIVAARGLLTLPIIVHCMTEFPLYLSALHCVLLILLLRLALPTGCSRQLTRSGGYVAASVVTICCLSGAVFTITGIQSAFTLQEAESFHLMDPTILERVTNPYAQPDRLLFDQAVSELMLFNLQQDPALLAQFSQLAADWLTRHNDANLITTMMQLAHRKNDIRQELLWRKRGCHSFMQDPRFHCNSLPSIFYSRIEP